MKYQRVVLQVGPAYLAHLREGIPWRGHQDHSLGLVRVEHLQIVPMLVGGCYQAKIVFMVEQLLQQPK